MSLLRFIRVLRFVSNYLLFLTSYKCFVAVLGGKGESLFSPQPVAVSRLQRVSWCSIRAKVTEIRNCFTSCDTSQEKAATTTVSTGLQSPPGEEPGIFHPLLSQNAQTVPVCPPVLGLRAFGCPGRLYHSAETGSTGRGEEFASTATAGLGCANLEFCSVLCFKSKRWCLMQVFSI